MILQRKWRGIYRHSFRKKGGGEVVGHNKRKSQYKNSELNSAWEK